MARQWAALGAALALALAVVGAAPGKAQTLNVVMHSDLKIFDPVQNGSYIVRNYGYMIYDVLFALDDQLKPQPQMVESWQLSEDKLTYTFTLRADLEWHDGQPVTAEDCIASLKRWGARDPMGQKLLPFVKEFKAVDARTFQMALSEPYGLVIESLSKPSVVVPFMMPARVAATDPFQMITEYVGSGPFMLAKEDIRAGEKVTFRKNPRYKPRAEPANGLAGGKVVKLDRVVWIAMPDAQTQVNALINGEIDMLEAVPTDLMPLLEADKSIKLVRGKISNQYVFRPNWLHPPFNNEKIRQAAQMALNQEDFLKAAIGDPRFYRPCKALFTCGSPYASDVAMAGKIEGNAEAARALLKEAGYDGMPVVILHPTDLGVLKNLPPVAKNLLEKGGFKVELQAMDWQTLVTRLLRKEPAAQGGWNAFLTSWVQVDLLNPLMTPFLQANCEKARPGWPCDETMENLRLAFAKEGEPARKKQIAEEVQTHYMKIVSHVHLGEWFGATAFGPKVEGWLEPPVTVFWNISKK